MVFSIGIQITMNFLEFYLSIKEFTISQIGLYVFVLSFVGVVGNFFVTPIILRKVDDKIYLVVILIISGIGLLITGLSGDVGLYGFMFMFSLASMMFKPITTQIISKNAGEEQGMALGVRETLIHFGFVVGSIAGGFLVSGDSGNIFLVSSAIMFVCAIGFGSIKYIEVRKV